MESKDFELLGRYHAALDDFEKLKSARHVVAHEITRALNKATEHYYNEKMNLGIIDHAKVIEKSQELAEVNNSLMVAVGLLNDLAEKTGKQKVFVTGG